MIDKKVRPDFRAGGNVNAGATMRPLRHDSRDKGQMTQIKFVRHALNGDRLQRRISEDDFLVAGGGWVAFVSGIDIGPQHLAHGRQLRKKSRQ